MPAYKPSDSRHNAVPGMSLLTGWARAYGRAFNRHVAVVNELWDEIHHDEVKLRTFARSYSKLFHACETSVKEICGVYSEQAYSSHSGVRTLAFVLDGEAQASGEPETLVLPWNVDPNRLKATLLPLVEVPGPNGSRMLPVATVGLKSAIGGTAVDVTIAGVETRAARKGPYFSLIYLPNSQVANEVAPPPKEVYGVVALSFV